jgi:predicted O-methyltransferase YrrM
VAGRIVKRFVLRVAGSSAGRRALAHVGKTEPSLLVEALGPRINRGARFDTVRRWPERLDGFDDLAFLFSSNQLHHAIISMNVHEGAYLFALARSLRDATIVEIGRSKGGSTLLLAAAMDPSSRLVSYDLYLKWTSGRKSDDELRGALARYGLEDRVELVVADSRTADGPAADLVLVDGDHSYDGVRADWEAWRGRVRPGGHIVFHDAVPDGISVPHEGLVRAVTEIRRDAPGFTDRGGAGTLAHLQRTG